jgi:hypothetical protein
MSSNKAADGTAQLLRGASAGKQAKSTYDAYSHLPLHPAKRRVRPAEDETRFFSPPLNLGAA